MVPSKGQWSLIRFHRWTLRLFLLKIRCKGSNTIDGCAGCTVKGMMVRQCDLSRDNKSKKGNLGLTDPNDGLSRDRQSVDWVSYCPSGTECCNKFGSPILLILSILISLCFPNIDPASHHSLGMNFPTFNMNFR